MARLGAPMTPEETDPASQAGAETPSGGADVPASESAASPEPPPPPAPPRGVPTGRRIATAIPWILLIVAAGAAALFLALWHADETQISAAKQVKAQASHFVTALTNFSYKTIDGDIAQIRRFAAGSFLHEVGQTFSKQNIAALKHAKATSHAHLNSVFIQSVSGGTASAFAVVTETFTNANSRSPNTQIVRMSIDLIKTGGAWKVDTVRLFQSPGGGLLGAGG